MNRYMSYGVLAPKDMARVLRSSESLTQRLENLANQLDEIAAKKRKQEQERIECEIESKHLIHFL